MDGKKSASWKLIIAIIAVIAAAAFAYGRIRLLLIGNEVKQFTRSTGIAVEYVPDKTIAAKEDLLTEIWELARWEEKTRNVVNKAYGHSDLEFSEKQKYHAWSKEESKNGYEDRDEIYSYMMEKEWYSERLKLQQTVRESITSLFGNEGYRYGLSREAVQESYRRGYLNNVVSIMSYAEQGMGEEAFAVTKYGLSQDPSALPMDIAYGLYPDLMVEGCRNYLQSELDKNEWFYVSIAADSVEYFQERYGVEIEELKTARNREKHLAHKNKQDAPKAGTTQSRKPRGKSTYAGKSSSSSFDPDDRDIESYYDDNRDEYDDYDDAYEGFMDDDDAWDDY